MPDHLGYRNDPEWQQAREILCDPEPSTATERLFVRLDAIRVMYRVESQYEKPRFM